MSSRPELSLMTTSNKDFSKAWERKCDSIISENDRHWNISPWKNSRGMLRGKVILLEEESIEEDKLTEHTNTNSQGLKNYRCKKCEKIIANKVRGFILLDSYTCNIESKEMKKLGVSKFLEIEEMKEQVKKEREEKRRRESEEYKRRKQRRRRIEEENRKRGEMNRRRRREEEEKRRIQMKRLEEEKGQKKNNNNQNLQNQISFMRKKIDALIKKKNKSINRRNRDKETIERLWNENLELRQKHSIKELNEMKARNLKLKRINSRLLDSIERMEKKIKKFNKNRDYYISDVQNLEKKDKQNKLKISKLQKKVDELLLLNEKLTQQQQEEEKKEESIPPKQEKEEKEQEKRKILDEEINKKENQLESQKTKSIEEKEIVNQHQQHPQEEEEKSIDEMKNITTTTTKSEINENFIFNLDESFMNKLMNEIEMISQSNLKFYKDREHAFRWIRDLVEKKFPYSEVCLVGSFYHGTAIPGSDVDVDVFNLTKKNARKLSFLLNDKYGQSCKFVNFGRKRKKVISLILDVFKKDVQIDVNINNIESFQKAEKYMKFGKKYPSFILATQVLKNRAQIKLGRHSPTKNFAFPGGNIYENICRESLLEILERERKTTKKKLSIINRRWKKIDIGKRVMLILEVCCEYVLDLEYLDASRDYFLFDSTINQYQNFRFKDELSFNRFKRFFEDIYKKLKDGEKEEEEIEEEEEEEGIKEIIEIIKEVDDDKEEEEEGEEEEEEKEESNDE